MSTGLGGLATRSMTKVANFRPTYVTFVTFWIGEPVISVAFATARPAVFCVDRDGMLPLDSAALRGASHDCSGFFGAKSMLLRISSISRVVNVCLGSRGAVGLSRLTEPTTSCKRANERDHPTEGSIELRGQFRTYGARYPIRPGLASNCGSTRRVWSTGDDPQDVQRVRSIAPNRRAWLRGRYRTASLPSARDALRRFNLGLLPSQT